MPKVRIVTKHADYVFDKAMQLRSPYYHPGQKIGITPVKITINPNGKKVINCYGIKDETTSNYDYMIFAYSIGCRPSKAFGNYFYAKKNHIFKIKKKYFAQVANVYNGKFTIAEIHDYQPKSTDKVFETVVEDARYIKPAPIKTYDIPEVFPQSRKEKLRRNIMRAFQMQGIRDINWDYNAREILSTIGYEPVNKKGKFAKRLAAEFKKRAGKKIENEYLQEISNLFSRQFKSTALKITFEITTDLQWMSGDFGDKGSCYWSEYSQARDYIGSYGGYAIKVYDGYEGIGRAWAVPYHDHFVIFNSYGNLNGNFLETETMAVYLSTIFKTDYKKVILNVRGNVYINGNTGYVIGDVSNIDDEIYIDNGSTHGGQYYADDCENIRYCTDCEDRFYIDEMTEVNHSYYCDCCVTNFNICEYCDCYYINYCENCYIGACKECGEDVNKQDEYISLDGYVFHNECMGDIDKCPKCDNYYVAKYTALNSDGNAQEICRNCVHNGVYYRCPECYIYHQGEGDMHGRYICANCDERRTDCDICGARAFSTYKLVDGKKICDNCRRSHATQCYKCLEYHYDEDIIKTPSGKLCHDCYDQDYDVVVQFCVVCNRYRQHLQAY
jgi:hypothetical protein